MSATHLILLLVILLLVFGPNRIEGIGSSLGKAVRGFKKGLEGDEPKKEETKIIVSDSHVRSEKVVEPKV